MSRTMRILLIALVALVALSVAAQASVKIQKDFVAKYPDAKAKLGKCATCHTPGKATKEAPLLNAYGTDLKTGEFKFESIESKDSDKDGATNIAEIKALANPGDAKDKPAKAAKGAKVVKEEAKPGKEEAK